MSIRVIDKDFNLIAEFDSHESFQHTRKFQSAGSFDLNLKRNDENYKYLQRENIIIYNNDPNLSGVIEHREVQGNFKSDSLPVKGCSLSGLLHRRVISPDASSLYMAFSGKQETIMKNFVDKNCINPTNKDRVIDNLVIAQDLGRGKDDNWRSAYDALDLKLEDIAKYANFGWDVKLDLEKKKFVFDISEGRDLTIDQSILPPVVFSAKFDNIKSRHYTESDINTCNSVYIGEKETEGKAVLNYGTGKGFERREQFQSFSGTVDEIKKESEKVLEELKTLKTFELEVDPEVNFIYKVDYDLGDTVTLQDNTLGITMNSRILAITETYVKGQMTLQITFDKLIPNLMDKLKKL